MPRDKYLRIYLNTREVEFVNIEELDLTVDYSIESGDDFQTKKGSRAYDIEVPASQANDKIFNSFYNDAIQDMTPGQTHRNTMTCQVMVGGSTLLSGFAVLKGVTRGHLPQKYTFNCYGGNGDWAVKLRDTTLRECLNPATHILNDATVQASWLHDGTDETKDYVYAPVRYRRAFDDNDTNVRIVQLRPAIFVKWLIIRAFRSIGYRVVSKFFDTEYFRRQVMPWTWGDFLNLNSNAAQELKFKATGDLLPGDITNGVGPYHYWRRSFSGTGSQIWGPSLVCIYTDNDGSGGFHIDNILSPPGYSNNPNVYTYDANYYTMKFYYPPSVGVFLNTITAHFTLQTLCNGDLSYNCNCNLYARVYHNGVQIYDQGLMYNEAPYMGAMQFSYGCGGNGTVVQGPIVWTFSVPNLNPGDTVDVQYYVRFFKSTLGDGNIAIHDAFQNGDVQYNATYLELTGIEIQPGSVIDLKEYGKFKNYKFLDMLRGLIDFYDLMPTTDSNNRVVYFEPAFPYSTNSNFAIKNEGHFNGKALDWRDKQDLAQGIDLPLFSDMEREFYQKFKDDNSDGGINKYIGRNQIAPGISKYLFPNRFIQGKRVLENRFFTACMHIIFQKWKQYSPAGLIPQLPVIIPENVSNTSQDVSEIGFEPRLLYYKGLVDFEKVGVWKYEGNEMREFPFMFAVNYIQVAPDDPILTYCDQLTGPPAVGGVIGVGLAKRFFMNRLAMFRNGQQVTKHFHLNNNDVQNFRHRENIILNHNSANGKWLLFSIDGYQPLTDKSTKCTLWKQSPPLAKVDLENYFPSQNTITLQPQAATDPDINYKELLLNPTDLPQ